MTTKNHLSHTFLYNLILAALPILGIFMLLEQQHTQLFSNSRFYLRMSYTQNDNTKYKYFAVNALPSLDFSISYL